MKTIIRSLILLLIASYSMSAQGGKYTISKMYGDGVRFNGFSTVVNETVYFTEEAKQNALEANKVRSFTLPEAKISTMQLSKNISPKRFVVSNGEKFIITTDNKLYRENAGQYENVKLPELTNDLWDVKFVGGEIYVFQIMGEVFYSINMGEEWNKIGSLYAEGAPLSNIVFNNKLYVGKGDSLFWRDGNAWVHKVLPFANGKKDVIEGMTTNSTDLFFYTSNNNIFKFKDNNFEQISAAHTLDVCGLSVSDNEELLLLTDYAIYRKPSNDNDFVKLLVFPESFYQPATLKKENLIVKTANGYAIVRPDYILVSDNNAKTWRKAVVAMEKDGLTHITKVGDIVATANTDGVILSNVNDKVWYEVGGMQQSEKISNLINVDGELFAVGIKNIYSLGKSANAWKSVLTTQSEIRAAAINANNIYFITEKGLFKATAGNNELTLIDETITEGSLISEGNAYLLKDGILTTLNKKEDPVNLRDKGILIYDITSINRVLYAATNKGIIMLQGGTNFSPIHIGINQKDFKAVKAYDSRLYIIDVENNVFLTNVAMSKAVLIKTNLDFKVNDITGGGDNMYLATNRGAYAVNNINNDIFNITDYWVNMGTYQKHSSNFGKFVVPDYHTMVNDFSFVSNDKTSRMFTISALTGEVVSTVDLTELYSSISEGGMVSAFVRENNHLGDFTSFMFAPKGREVQDSLFTLKNKALALQKKFNFEGLTNDSKLNIADFISADGNVLFYHSYQANAQDPKSVKNQIFYGTSYNNVIALNDFLNGYPGVITKVKYCPSDAGFNSRILVARQNNNPSAPASERAMISILNHNGTKIIGDIKLENTRPISAMDQMYATVGDNAFEVLAYSTKGTGELSDEDAIVFYDMTNNKEYFSFKGLRVYDMKALDNSSVATLVTMKEEGKIVNMLLVIDINRKAFIHGVYLEEAFFGKMTIDDRNQILVFGNDGILRKFENVRDEQVLNASFYAEKTTVKVGETVKFISTSTGNPSTILYEFGDGSTANVSNPEYQYSTPGTYTVTLTITKDGRTSIDEKTNYITVVPEVGEFDFAADVVEGFAPFDVKFTEVGTDNITERRWDFGDGETSNLKNPLHTYKKTGRFNVSLTLITGAESKTVTKYHYIIVDEEPANYKANFVAEYASGTAPFNAKFYDQTEGGATEWLWDFGDGTTSTEKHPVHLYRECGSYTVSLFVKKDGLESKTTKQRYISVHRGNLSGLYVKDEIELIDTTANVMAVDLVRNADNTSVTFDVRHEDIASGKLTGKVAFFEPRKSDDKAPINFYTLPEAVYNKNILKFITPVRDNQFQYISQYRIGENDNFAVYNAGLTGNMKSLVQKYEMKLKMTPVALANFDGEMVGALTMRDSSLVLTFVNKDGVGIMNEIFKDKPISNKRLPILQMKDKNYMLIYKPENENMQYVIFDKQLNIVKTNYVVDNVLYYPTAAYTDADGNIVLTGEKKFNAELEAITNYIAKFDQTMNLIFDKEFTATFKVTGITELIRRWNQKSYVCSGQIEGHCAIAGFSAEGDITMKNKLTNRKGILNQVVRVNENELVFAGTIYSNVADRLNFYAMHMHQENSYSDVEDSEVDNSLKIYPNPSNGIISTNDMEIYSLKVFDQAGKVVFEIGNPAEAIFDLSFLNNGFYTLVINTPAGAKVGKLIIAK